MKHFYSKNIISNTSLIQISFDRNGKAYQGTSSWSQVFLLFAHPTPSRWSRSECYNCQDGTMGDKDIDWFSSILYKLSHWSLLSKSAVPGAQSHNLLQRSYSLRTYEMKPTLNIVSQSKKRICKKYDYQNGQNCIKGVVKQGGLLFIWFIKEILNNLKDKQILRNTKQTMYQSILCKYFGAWKVFPSKSLESLWQHLIEWGSLAVLLFVESKTQ